MLELLKPTVAQDPSPSPPLSHTALLVLRHLALLGRPFTSPPLSQPPLQVSLLPASPPGALPSQLTSPEQLREAGVGAPGSGSGRGQGGATGLPPFGGWGGGLAWGLHTLRHCEVRA